MKDIADNEGAVNGDNIPNFNFNADTYDDIVGFVFLLGNAEHKISFYKKQYPISLMRRDTIMMLKKDAQRLVRVEDDIIKLNETFEFLQLGDEMVVLSLKTLERYFGFDEIIRNQANNTIQVIQQANLLFDIGPLQELANELRFAKKLMRVRADSPVLQVPFNQVRVFILNHPKLRRRMRFTADNAQISLDTRVSKELFIKILTDDFLKSELTQLLYDSDIKDQLSHDEAEDHQNAVIPGGSN